MAATESPTAISATPLMVDVSFPRAQLAFGGHENSAMGSTLYQRRGAQETGPLELHPNPDFVFPARPLDSPPVLPHWNALNRRPRSDQNLSASASACSPALRQRPSTSNLPHFTFNPSTGPSSTPPHSPTIPASPTTPSRGTRHRRGGSEFIGGDGRSGGVAMLSSSPAKTEAFSPPTVHLGPPPGRRHAHRRSGAISCHDLQAIMKPPVSENSSGRGGSAPVTPRESDNKPFFPPSQSRRTASSNSLRASAEIKPTPAQESESPQRRPPSRARVGFSERVEYIRPLSTISSETEGSMSTIRGHSVSGSLSSVISAGAPSPPSARMSRPLLNTTFEHDTCSSRPLALSNGFEAQASWSSSQDPSSRTQPQLAESSPPPSIAGSPTAAPKRKGYPWSRKCRSPPPSLTDLPTDSDPSATSPLESPTSVVEMSLDLAEEVNPDRRGSTSSQKSPRKPRKVKSWAHYIMSRKPKGDKSKKVTRVRAVPVSPTSPTTSESLSPVDMFNFEGNFEANFDVDNTVTIISENLRVQPASPPLKPRSDCHESDSLSPVIDLDAALGPFNTPPLGSNTRMIRPSPRAHRSMHSLGFNSPSFAPGLPSHRRTESAPELVPFEIRNAKVPPPPSMPDVFEEEDEEELDSTKRKSVTGEQAPTEDEEEEMNDSGMGIQVDVDNSGSDDARTAVETQINPTPVGLAIGSPSHDNFDNQSPITNTVSDSGKPSKPTSVEVVEDYEEPRDSKASDETITPAKVGGHEAHGFIQYSFPLHQPSVMTPDTISGSSFPSPDFNYSQASFDTPRLGTATSSVNDNRSFSLGEPGPEVRISVDDVPSLTSSRSTMTGPPSNRPFTGIPANTPPFPGCRSPSIVSSHSSFRPVSHSGIGGYSSAVNGNGMRPKRNSIASLSRLMTGGFAERSKLSIESRPMSQHTDGGGSGSMRKKKSHRLSRLMSFWRSKEPKNA